MEFNPETSISVEDPLQEIPGIGAGTQAEFEDTYNARTIQDALIKRLDITDEVGDPWKEDAKLELLKLNPSAKEIDVKSREQVDCLLYKCATNGGFYDSDGNTVLKPLETGAYMDGARNRANTVQVSPRTEINTLSSIFEFQPTLFVELEMKSSYREYLFARAKLRDIDTEELRFKPDDIPFVLLSEKYLKSVSHLFGIDYTQKKNLQYIQLADRPDFPLKLCATDRDSAAVIAPRFGSDSDQMRFSKKDGDEVEFVNYYEI